MSKTIRNKVIREDGFTLIELMLVVSVLGIISGIAVPRITGVREEANIAALRSTATTIRNAIERERSITGSYPDLSGITTGNSISDIGDELNYTSFSADNSITVESVPGSTGAYPLEIGDSNGNTVEIAATGITVSTN